MGIEESGLPLWSSYCVYEATVTGLAAVVELEG